MMFQMEFNTGNAAFEDSKHAEIARILRAAAKVIEDEQHVERSIHDANGNRIGGCRMVKATLRGRGQI
jgi:hypothetical protein